MNKNFLAWLIWILAVSFYFYEFMLQVSPGVLSQDLIKTFGISSVALGMFGAAYYYTYAPMQIPAGILIDKYGPKKILSIAIACCLAGVLLFCVASSFKLLIVARAIIGFGSAFAMIGTLKLASNWFSETKFAFVAGLTYFVGMSGALIGKVPLDIFLDYMDWQTAFVYFFFIGCLILCLFLLIVKDKPETLATKQSNVQQPLVEFFKILKQPQIWLIAFYSGLMIAGVLALGALWGEQYLIQVKAQSRREAATLLSLIFMGYAIGSPIIGKFSDKIRRRQLPLKLGALGALLFYAGFIYLPLQNNITFYAMAFLFGFSNSFAIVAFPLAKEICHQDVAATAIAFVNFITMGLGALGQFSIGLLLHWLSYGSSIFGTLVFHLAFLLFVFTYLAAFIISCFIKETYGKQSGFVS